MLKKALILLSFCFSALLFFGCSSSVRFSSAGKNSQPSSSKQFSGKKTKTDAGISSIREKIAQEAQKLLGTPYCYGGTGYDCFDCSGFVLTVFQNAGVTLPRTSGEQFKEGTYINSDEARTGDLVFFGKNSEVNHVGIYLGSGWFIHASTSSGVIIQYLGEEYYATRLLGFRKYVE